MRIDRISHYSSNDKGIPISGEMMQMARNRVRGIDIFPILTVQDLLSTAYLLGVIDMSKTLHERLEHKL